MSAQGGAVTSGFGSASLRLSADEAQAVLIYNYSNLTTPVVAKHIHSDAHGGEISVRRNVGRGLTCWFSLRGAGPVSELATQSAGAATVAELSA